MGAGVRNQVQPVSRRERRKGRDGELELRRLLAEHGLQVETLGGRQGQADALAVHTNGARLMVESKRQETARVWAWWAQARANADDTDCVPVVGFRRNGGEWLALLSMQDLCRMIGRP